MDEERDVFLASLLGGSGGATGRAAASGKPLISELPLPQLQHDEAAKETAAASAAPAPVLQQQDGKSVLEMMMESQSMARKEKDAEESARKQKELTSGKGGGFGGGFKKGFLGGNGEPKKTKPTGSGGSSAPSASIPTISASSSASASASSGKKMVIEEVQRAMQEAESPIVRQLQQGEWITPDVMKVFASNPVISKGLQSQKCVKAMELMQTDPKRAKEMFQHDAEVDLFLREFGAVMSAHFECLAAAQAAQNAEAQAKAREEELGPLAAAAIKKEEQQQMNRSKSKISPLPAESPSTSMKKKGESEEERVHRILQDPELKALLMDPQMQRVLQDCSSPESFSRHMQNPDTARKITMMMQAGLLAVEK